MSNVVCLKHRHYRGDTAPELSCKMCCAMFVARIRAEQASSMQDDAQSTETAFKPLVGEPVTKKQAKPSVAKAGFDSSWV